MENFEETKRLLEHSVLFYIITTGMDGNYTYVNHNYARQFAYISGSFVGQPYHITMHPEDKNTCIAVSVRCFQHPHRMFPATIRKHDGKGGYVYTQWEYRAMLATDGSPAGIFCLGYNITKYVAEGMELDSATAALAKNAAAFERIVFQQSHLIRAPLSNIMGLTNILDLTSMEGEAASICAMLSESAHQLDGVIREIIDTAYE